VIGRAQLLLLALGAAALVALAGVGEPSREAASPPRAGAAASPVAEASSTEQRPDTGLLQYGAAFQRQPLPEVGQAFGPKSWAPPASPPAAAAEPPRPVAPPPPYVFLGTVENGDGLSAYLRRGNALLAARAHDTLDAHWRLEEIGTASLVFTYLPLNQQMVLPRTK
jgi:hypothetical protein